MGAQESNSNMGKGSNQNIEPSIIYKNLSLKTYTVKHYHPKSQFEDFSEIEALVCENKKRNKQQVKEYYVVKISFSKNGMNVYKADKQMFSYPKTTEHYKIHKDWERIAWKSLQDVITKYQTTRYSYMGDNSNSFCKEATNKIKGFQEKSLRSSWKELQILQD